MNIVEHVSFLPVGTSLDICPEEVSQDIPVVLCTIFGGIARLISRVFVPACNPTNNVGVLFFLHILANICCHPCFLILAILTGVRWNHRVVLSCISLMTQDVEHFFKCFSAIQESSVENSLFSSVLHF